MTLPPLHHLVSLSDDWFEGLPEALRDDIRARARRRVLEPGQRLYSRGDAADGIYGVLEGSVRVSGVSGDGRETVLDFYGPGAWFGEVATLDGLPRLYDAHAHRSTALLQLTPADLEELLVAHRALGRALLRLEAYRVRAQPHRRQYSVSGSSTSASPSPKRGPPSCRPRGASSGWGSKLRAGKRTEG